MPKHVYFETYGCTSNMSDSMNMMGILKNRGYEITENEEDADYVVVNTCAVKSKTEDKIISRLKTLSNSGKKVIVAGCLTKVNKKRIEESIPNFSGMLDTKSIHRIPDVLDSNQKLIFSDKPEDKPSLPRISISDTVDIIKMSEGCLSNCTFCATKIARGNLFSYRPESIRDAFRKGVLEGKKEFYLTSEDSSAYGRDIGTSLPELMNSVTKIKGDFFIRVGMMNPLHFKKVEISDLIKSFENEKIFKFLHICLQSGSDKILKIMRRGYDVNDYKYYIKKFRERFPEMTIWTDIIVGHPGETEDDFNQTIQLLEETKPDFVNISAYGSRLGTISSKMKQIDSGIKKERTRKLTETVNKISVERNNKWKSWEGKILIDEYNFKKKNFIGRNFAYKLVVVKGDFKIGDIVNVKIKDVKSTHLSGEVLK